MPSVTEPTIIDVGLEEVRRCLWGKSHFFDRDTMRFFGSRLLLANRCGDALLALVRDKHPSNGLVFSVVLLSLEHGQDKRVLKHDPSRSRARRIFDALWQDMMSGKAEAESGNKNTLHDPGEP